jgi:hypothetical protein
MPVQETYKPLRQKFPARKHTNLQGMQAEVPGQEAYKPLRQKFPPRKHTNL